MKQPEKRSTGTPHNDAHDEGSIDPAALSRRQFLETSLVGGLLGGLLPLTCEASSVIASSGNADIELRVVGSEKEGYGVTLFFRGQSIASHNGGGEFSAVFQNGERSLEDRIEDWKPSSWQGDTRQVILHGSCYLKNAKAEVFAEIEYKVLDAHVVRKRIRLHQSDMFMLYHQISNRLEPTVAPAKFWSFDQAECRGGSLRENFPAAGFRTKEKLCVGLLTDSGFRNQWSRIVRRDGKPVKPAPSEVPDPELYRVCAVEERKQGRLYVQQTFGELLRRMDNRILGQGTAVPESSSWVKCGQAVLERNGDWIALLTSRSNDGVLIPVSVNTGSTYSLSVEYRSQEPIAVQVWDVNEKLEKLQEITMYNDTIPASGTQPSVFQNTFFIPECKGSGAAIFISLPESDQATQRDAVGGAKKIEIRKFVLYEIPAHRQPYHRLDMDRVVEKTVFIFVDDSVADTLRGCRMASQIHLANALGLQGGEAEKIVYADLMMLCWNADTDEVRPMLAPSIWYSAAGEMYLRDSFFAINGAHNRQLNESVFRTWGENQGENGAINTLVEPAMANVERKSNDSTPLWLMWALLNRRRFSTELPIHKIRRAAEYCLKTYDRGKDATCWAQFVMGQLDVISYPEGTSALCENQGMLAVTLRVIRELQIPGLSETISEEYIQKAEEIYRGYYDPERKFLTPIRGVADAIGVAELFPEFLSLWLFHRKMLPDEIVCNHLDRIPVLMPRPDCPFPEMQGTVRPVLIGLLAAGGWSYFSEKWHPVVSNAHAANYAGHAMDGVYYNGGSWMRIEVCAYVTGLLHGWSKATKAIANRLWAEIHIDENYPTSQEYLATTAGNPFFGYHRVFGWNSFVLPALELAGLRTPDMDPDYGEANTSGIKA
jgi:hypothetical protein